VALAVSALSLLCSCCCYCHVVEPDDALVPHTLVSLAKGTLDPGVSMNLGSDGKDMRNALKDWYTSKQCSASAAKDGKSTQYKLICSTDQPVKTKHTAASGGVPIRCGSAVNVNKRADGRWFVTHAVTEHKTCAWPLPNPQYAMQLANCSMQSYH
jgi:hypothetical protein